MKQQQLCRPAADGRQARSLPSHVSVVHHIPVECAAVSFDAAYLSPACLRVGSSVEQPNVNDLSQAVSFQNMPNWFWMEGVLVESFVYLLEKML